MASVDKSLIPQFVVKEGLVNSCLTRGADFEAYTSPMQADQTAPDGQYLVNMIGSSTVKDLQGDIMALSALEDMTKIPDNLTILMNHDSTVPDSIFGGLHGRPQIKAVKGIADLHLSVDVETSNPKAMQTYNMISRGRRLGCSIGCMVNDYKYDDKEDALIILSVTPVEYSVVSIPAQQRCWVEVATKSLFERSLLEGRADDALKLASAVRGMFWRSYDALVKHVESGALKKDLERITPRETASHRVMYSFGDGDNQFVLTDGKKVTKSLTRDEVSSLLEEKKLDMVTPTLADPEESKEQQSDDKEKLAKGVLDSDSDISLSRQDVDEEQEGEKVDNKEKSMPETSKVSSSEDGSHDQNVQEIEGQKSELPDSSANLTTSDVPVEIIASDTPVLEMSQSTSTIPATVTLSNTSSPGADNKETDLNPVMTGIYKTLVDQANAVGAALGIAPLPLEKAMSVEKSIMPVNMNPQDVISLISNIDRQVDELMDGFGIPDIDETDDDSGSPMSGQYSTEAQVTKALNAFFTIKEGRTISQENMKHVNAIMSCALALGAACPHCGVSGDGVQHQNAGTDVTQAENAANMSTQMSYQEGITKHIEAITQFTKSLESITTQDVIDSTVAKALSDSQASIKALRKEQDDVIQRLNKIKSMPLGRPTSFVGRTVEPHEDTASYSDFLSGTNEARTWSLDEALAQTESTERGGLHMRMWPESVGGDVHTGVRPRLTETQKTYMSPADIVRYNEGKKSFVPLFNEK